MTRVVPSPPERPAAARWPRLPPDLLAVVFVGGSVGGYLRYAVTQAWPDSPGGVPWATLSVNVAGAFVLTVVVVLAAEVTPSRYLRPLLGTGLCGGLTTFSQVVLTTDRLVAHHSAVVGVSYLLATVVAGLLAAWLGLVTGRAAVAWLRHARRGKDAS